MRYWKRGKSNNPALFISLVQVVECQIYEGIRAQNKNGIWQDRKSLTANFLPSQELGLACATLGAVYDSDVVTIPSWVASGDDREHGLSFQTKPSAVKGSFNEDA